MKKNPAIQKILLTIFFLQIILVSCTSKEEKIQNKKEIKNHQNAENFYKEYINLEKNKTEQKILNYISELSLEEKVAQLFIENLEGNTQFRSYETYDKITGKSEDSTKPVIAGGYLFFSYNICNTPEEQKQFINTIHDYCKKHNQIEPFLAVDQEGGYVNRLKKLTDRLPSQEEVAETMSVEQAYKLYSDQAVKMQKMGFTMNLAPVIEICTEDNKDFLDGRSFGSYEQVCNYGISCINAYQNNAISTVIKHFPGNTNTDPHVGLPVIDLSEKELFDSIKSFKTLCEYNPDAILMSHAITTAVDDGVPACLSSVWISEILRKEYNYEGIIFSDDIFMGALAKNGYPPEIAAVKAIEAGIDCIMISEKRIAKPASIIYKKALNDKEFEQKVNRAVERIIKYKINKKILGI